MTVISTIISHYCTVHASDSFLTPRLKRGDKRRRKGDDQQTKIVRVAYWRGAMSYWGLASLKKGADDPPNWFTVRWMQEQANRAQMFQSPEEFAQDMAIKLNQIIDRVDPLPNKPLSKGIGIHFTAYELVNGYPIPELFFISNFTHDVEHPTLSKDGVHCSRQTFNVIKQIENGTGVASRPEDRDAINRQYVYDYLSKGRMLIFNNGDTEMFNPAAKAILTLLRVVVERGHVSNPNDIATYRNIARRPVEIVSEVQRDFVQEEHRIVGGKIHDLLVTPAGDCSSSSGDCD